MNLSRPNDGLITDSIAQVIAGLATSGPITGRGLASKVEISTGQVNQTLIRLVRLGIVSVVDRPPAKVYALNRNHIHTEALLQLSVQNMGLEDWLRSRLQGMAFKPALAVIFGSYARREADAESDLDLYLVVSDEHYLDKVEFEAALVSLREKFFQKFGNELNTVSLKMSEAMSSFAIPGRFEINLLKEGMALIGEELFRALKELRIEQSSISTS